MKNHIRLYSISFAAGAAVVSLLTGVHVWAQFQGPTQAPPQGNVPAPVNVGDGYQSKTGNLAVNSGNVGLYGLLIPFGRVGVGTSTPAEELDVVGDIRASGDICLTSGICLSTAGGGGGGGGGGWTDSGTNVHLTNQNDFVGIGTSNPLAKLHISLADEVIIEDSVSGSPELHFRSPNATYWGIHNLGSGGGNPNAFRIRMNDTDRTGTYDNGDSNWQTRFIMERNGNAGIGTGNWSGGNAPQFALDVHGNARKSSGGQNWVTTSDARLKDVIGSYEYGLAEILQLEPVRFTYREGNAVSLPSGEEMAGLIAQEVQKVMPEAVSVDGNGYLNLDGDWIDWAMLNAVQELKAENNDLRARIEALEAQE